MGWRDVAIPIDDQQSSQSWRSRAIPVDSDEDRKRREEVAKQRQERDAAMKVIEEQRTAETLKKAEQYQNLARAEKVLGESNLPGIKAYAIEAGADIVSPIARLLGHGEYADRMNRFAQAVEQVQAEREAGGVVPDILQRGVRGAGRSLTTMAGAGMVGGPYAAIAAAVGQESNRAITEGRDAGLKGGKLASYAVAQGIVEGLPAAVMQKIGMGGAETLASGRGAVGIGIREGLKRLGISFAQELPEELVTEIGHNLAAKVSQVGPEALSMDSLTRTVADTTVQTALTIGMAGAPGTVKSYQLGKVAAIREEMLKVADSGKSPSRAQWKKWGLPQEGGMTRKQRRVALEQILGRQQPSPAPVSAPPPAPVVTETATVPPEEPPAEQPPAETPPEAQPPVEQPPVETPPEAQPPVEQPPAEQPPVAAQHEAPQPPPEPPVEQPPAPEPQPQAEDAVAGVRRLIHTWDQQAAKYEGGRGIAVGAEGINYRWAADAGRVFLEQIEAGKTPQEAGEIAKQQARQWIAKHNSRRPKDRAWQRWEGAADSNIDTYVRMLVQGRPQQQATAMEALPVAPANRDSIRKLTPILEKQVGNEISANRKLIVAIGVMHGESPEVQRALASRLQEIAPDAVKYANSNPKSVPIALRDVFKGMEQKPQVPPEAEEAAEFDAMAQSTAPARHDMSVEKEGTGEVVSARGVVRRIEEIWGIPIRSGRMGARGARGIYKLRPQVARLAKGEESSLAVAAHEVAHHMDRTSSVRKGLSDAVKNELGTLDYDQNLQRTSEGYAEFVRAYVTGATAHVVDIDLSQAAPLFLAHFEQFLAANPDYRAKIDAMKASISQWRKAGAVGRVKGQISETGVDRSNAPPLMVRLNELKEFFYTRLKEEGRPVKRFVEEAKKRGYDPAGDTTPFEDYNALRQIGPHFAANAIEHGVFRITGKMDKIGPSLRDALEEIGDEADYSNFVAWAYARHAIESWQKGKNPGITAEDARDAYNKLYDPRYERAADKVSEFNNALIVVLADVGAIDPQTAGTIIQSYEHYIPLERAKEGRATGSGGKRMVDLSSAVKTRRGSGLQIVDPIESTLARAIRFYERAAKQIVTNKIVEVSQGTSGLGEWVELVPKKVMATHFNLEEIQTQLAEAIDAAGLDSEEILEAMDPETALTVWRPDLAKVHGVPIVRVTINGQPVFFQLHPELARALGGLEILHNLDIATQVARKFTSTLKIGATRFNPDFILSNAFRDFQVFLMQGEKGLKGAVDPAQYACAYVVSELRNAAGEVGHPVVELWRRMGGELSTYTGLDRYSLRKGVRRALAGRQSKLSAAINIAGTPEVASRIAEFSAVLQKEGWLDRVERGETPPMPVLIRAINAAHDVTVDFRRMGSWGRYLNYWIPFFNARLEGLDKTVRTFRDKPARTAMRVGMNVVPLALLYWWIRHDDDDYKERPEWQDQFWVIPDANGNPAFRIPKAQEWGLLASGVERMMDLMYEKDPEAIERWGKQVFSAANPGAYPAGITPLFESMFNYDSFRGRPIVSESLQKLENPDQYYEYTSGLAKSSAKFLHEYSGGKISLSPAKIDHMANGITGGLYRKATEPVEKIATGDPWSFADIPGLKGVTLRKDYAKSVDDLYATEEKLSKAFESAKLRGETIEDESRLRTLQGVTSLMTEMRKAARELPTEERERVGIAMVGLARAALDREPLERYPNPLAELGVLPDEVQKVVVDHIAQRAITASKTKPNAITDRAAEYLRELGVAPGQAQLAAYMRLRKQGISHKAASQRIGTLMIRVP